MKTTNEIHSAMHTARSINKQKRRERILTEARTIIAERGFDAFNLRDLAERSALTVPTVYNLIGNKDEILKALILGAFADFETEFICLFYYKKQILIKMSSFNGTSMRTLFIILWKIINET